MRCLILGGDGMLGHQLFEQLDGHEVRATVRRHLGEYPQRFSTKNTYDQVDVRDVQRLTEVFADFLPEVVINAVGIIKQRKEALAAADCIEINALMPHRLLTLCQASGARLIHISTDCVFSGRRGNYSEDDPCDAEDLYGRSKHLGEVSAAPAITLRTSIIGLELKNYTSLIEWYLRQHGTIQGFRRAIYSGLTTMEFARVVRLLIEAHPTLTGLWHVASEPISKYDLLSNLNHKLQRSDLTIVANDQFTCDRSLCGSAFDQRTGYRAPTWDLMLDELVDAIQHRTQGMACYDAA